MMENKKNPKHDVWVEWKNIMIKKYYDFFKNNNVINWFNDEMEIVEYNKYYGLIKIKPIDGFIDETNNFNIHEIWIYENGTVQFFTFFYDTNTFQLLNEKCIDMEIYIDIEKFLFDCVYDYFTETGV